MKIGIVGGALQGMEAVYLSKKAGYETLVIDRREDAPALSLADEAVVGDVEKERHVTEALAECDAILPANENMEALVAVDWIAEQAGVPLLFDLDAYRISESKLRSNELLQRLGVPMPRKWPSCRFPVVVKPSTRSGSTEVTIARNETEVERLVLHLRGEGLEPVVEEYVNGPNISIEVIGDGSVFTPYIVTDVILANDYDCKRVYSPWRGMAQAADELARYATLTARALGLRGIMDMEAIVVDGHPQVLEIDARIPSQTPAAILHSHGINLVEEMVKGLVHGRMSTPTVPQPRVAVYEHVVAKGDTLHACGEGEFSHVRHPRIVEGLFGADEAITDHRPGMDGWTATLMMASPNWAALRERRKECLRRIMDENHLSRYLDLFPEGYGDPLNALSDDE
jgi:pyrrolysine biosynthesis protein PylC